MLSSIDASLQADQVRIRIGAVLPSTNTVFESDIYRVIPPTVTAHFQRVWLTTTGSFDDSMRYMNNHIASAIESLAAARPRCIGIAGAGNTFFEGPDAASAQEDHLSQGAIPVITSSQSLLLALQSLNVRSVLVASPYSNPVNLRFRDYLEGAGYQVLGVASRNHFTGLEMSTHRNDALNDEAPQEIASFVVSNAKAAADAIVCPCAGWRAMEAAPHIERLTDMPVVTSNMATIWRLLSIVRQRPTDGDFGKLLRSL